MGPTVCGQGDGHGYTEVRRYEQAHQIGGYRLHLGRKGEIIVSAQGHVKFGKFSIVS